MNLKNLNHALGCRAPGGSDLHHYVSPHPAGGPKVPISTSDFCLDSAPEQYLLASDSWRIDVSAHVLLRGRHVSMPVCLSVLGSLNPGPLLLHTN